MSGLGRRGKAFGRAGCPHLSASGMASPRGGRQAKRESGSHPRAASGTGVSVQARQGSDLCKLLGHVGAEPLSAAAPSQRRGLSDVPQTLCTEYLTLFASK